MLTGLSHGTLMTRAAISILAAGLLTAGCAPAEQDGPDSPSSAAPPVSPSVTLTPSHELPGPSSQATSPGHARLTVAGSAQQLTADLPEGWQSFTFGAERGSSHAPSGIAFVVSLVDNAFSDPCAHVERDPKVGPTVDDLVTALGEIPSNDGNRTGRDDARWLHGDPDWVGFTPLPPTSLRTAPTTKSTAPAAPQSAPSASSRRPAASDSPDPITRVVIRPSSALEPSTRITLARADFVGWG